MTKRPQRQLEAEEQTPLFVLDHDFVESLKAPCEPPPRPAFKAEALFFLNTNGRNYVGGLSRLLKAYIATLKEPNLLASEAIVVREPSESGVANKNPILHPIAVLDPSTYFCGFGVLGEWISQTWALAFDEYRPQSNQALRLLDRTWMGGFANDTALQKDIAIVEYIESGLQYITSHKGGRKTEEIYWTLAMEYLEKTADENDQKYTTAPILRDKNSMADRLLLFEFLKSTGIFNTCFKSWITEEGAFTKEFHYHPLLDWLKRTLLSSGVMSIREVYEAALEETRSHEFGKKPTLAEIDSSRNAVDKLIGHPRNSPPQENFLCATQAIIPGENEKERAHSTATPKSGNLRERTVLLKVALRYIGKEYSPTADEIRCPTEKCKKFPPTFLGLLKSMSNPTISRAKEDLENEGYKFVSGYGLEPESFVRLEKEVDDNLALFKRFIKSQNKRRAKNSKQVDK